ncbi:ABC transporter substrate-binding protein [Acaryochloris sp. CCMEE 5410]|uniref:ABC transporter substrate-binding protein n=1 Tax=Acaryochloris sp. CCMEE 5410 TaxID=310037 RepID=UPI0006825A3B|nr:ABC transporter substrate-binding protein [Acaryochloris sp. CCMEE 5410]
MAFSQSRRQCLSIILLMALGWLPGCQLPRQTIPNEGASGSTITFGSVLALAGQEEGLGNRMKIGLETALKDQKVKGRSIRLIFKNDYYEPASTRQATQEIIQDQIFLMIGNVGTPTAKVSLPILAEQNIPAVGFFTGSGILRPGKGPIVNYRASYAQEIKAVVQLAIRNGVTPEQICAYVQNDSYGMSGLAGLKSALIATKGDAAIIQSFDKILTMAGDNPQRNHIGPVGVYARNTPNVVPGYQSIKAWEKNSGVKCRLIVTVGSYSNIARFASHLQQQGEKRIISAVSFTGGDDFMLDLEEYGIRDRVIMTHVAPLLDSNLPIVQEARTKLENEFGHVSLEGYIVGKMTLRILKDIPGEITRDSFMQQVARSQFDLGGVTINFVENHNQGSNLVILSYLTPQGFRTLDAATFKAMLQ